MLTFCLSNIVDQTVVSIVPAVYHCKGFPVINIPESEEIMLQQIHLENSFLTGHWLKVELLDTNDPQLILSLIGCKGCFFCCADKSILTQTTGKPGLIFADLAFDGS